MASIQKMAIRGIRAFSPDEKEEVIEFYAPVTMVVGRNGCGKTTIIECLRYAITGAFPPGGGLSAKSGQAFVHDPRVGGTKPTVKASVKLRFVSRSGQDFVVNRTMELTQKKSTVSFKQLDGVLRFTDEDTGQTVKNSHKCGELDKQIPNLLGISKAILDNVLFVHQEEASWPLMEGAVLKKRFDEIFDSTRYTKALDIIRKTEKDLLNDVKEIKIDLAALDARRDATREFKRELAEQNENEEGLMADKKKVVTELEALEAKMAQLEEIASKGDSIKVEIDALVAERQRLSKSLEEQTEMLEEDLTETHTLEEIQKKLADFDDKVSRQKEEQDALESQALGIQIEIDKLHAKQMDCKTKMGEITAKKEAHEQRLKDRLMKMEHIAKTHKIDLNNITQFTQGSNVSFLAADTVNESIYQSQDSAASGGNNTVSNNEVSASAWSAFIRAVKKKEKELNDQLREHQQTSQQEDDKFQKEVTELSGQITSHENERTKLVNRRNGIKQEMPRTQISYSSRLKQSDVDDYKERAEGLAKQRQALIDDPRRKDIPAEIRQLEDKMDTAGRKLQQEKAVLESLRETLERSNEIKVLEEESDKEFRMLQDSLADASSLFQQFNIPEPKLPKEGEDADGYRLREEIESTGGKIQKKHESQHNTLNAELEELTLRQRAVSEVSALKNRNFRALQALRTHLGQIRSGGSEEKVRQMLERLRDQQIPLPPEADERNPDLILEHVDAMLDTIEKEHITENVFTPDLANLIIKKIRKKAKDAEVCPCCSRSLNNDEYKMLKDAVKNLFAQDSEFTKVEEGPREGKQELQKARKIIQANMSDLRELSRASGEEEKLQSEMEKLRSESENAEKALNDQKAVVDDIRVEESALRELVDLSKRWIDDVQRIWGKRGKISQKRMDLNLDTPYPDRDLRTVEADVSKLADEKDKFATRINTLNKEMSKLNVQIAEIADKASQVADVAKEKEAAFQKQQEDEKKRKELTEEDKLLRDEENKIDDALLHLKRKLRVKESDKQRSRSLRNDNEKELVASINEFNADVSRLHELGQKIDEYSLSDGPTELERVDRELKSTVSETDKLKDDLRGLQPAIDRTKNLVKDQEREKSQLQYNIAIFEQKSRLVSLDEKIDRKKEVLKKIDGYVTAEGKLHKANSRKTELLERKAQFEGRYSEIVERIRSLKRKLMSEEYRDVDEQHRVATIKKETNQIAADDLKKYEKALDSALLQYHSVKITEVNKLIRELWTSTYKGEDITNIEIVSGQDPGSRAGKSYNYRVVMTKGTTDLDMRGRCSAGQRVLASLVIRLALAETFGINCGCIALDEPTVNLDYNNKKGLSQALAQLVEHRAKQKNFQLILITHDEEFVTMMKNELQCHTGFSMPEHYFRVNRELGPDGKYYSKINMVDWDEDL